MCAEVGAQPLAGRRATQAKTRARTVFRPRRPRTQTNAPKPLRAARALGETTNWGKRNMDRLTRRQVSHSHSEHHGEGAAALGRSIECEHRAALDARDRALEHARRCGELLRRAKDACPHGAWRPWLAANCPSLSERTAQRYMRLAERWPDLHQHLADPSRVSDLPIRDALCLLAAPARSAAAPGRSADLEVPAGHVLSAEVRDAGRRWLAFIHPSTEPAFVYVNVLVEDDQRDSGAWIGGGKRPIRREHAGSMLDVCGFPRDRVSSWLSAVATGAWTYNELLFDSHAEYVPQGILGAHA